MVLGKIKTGSKKAFTLIELLVVITIIGILATGAVATYTSQIQKSRDSTRLTDLSALRWALEQAYWDISYYPWVNNVATPDCSPTWSEANLKCLWSLWYLDKLPTDPKSWQAWNWTSLDYTYAVWPKDNVVKQIFEISTWFESSWYKTKAWSWADNWNDDSRLEIWHVAIWIRTHVSTTYTPAAPAAAMLNSTAGLKLSWVSCGILNGSTVAVAAGDTSSDTSANQSNIALIQGNCDF